MTKPQILWLRRDLRIADNPALYNAAMTGPVVPIYVLDDESAGGKAYGGASRWWLHHSLASLAQDLEARGGRLILRRGKASDVLAQVAAEIGADTIHANRHYEPWWRREQGSVAKTHNLTLYDGNYLMPPGHIVSGSGTPYKIYTPFAKATLAQMPPRGIVPEPECLLAPAQWPASDALGAWSLLPEKPDWAGGFRDFWQVGEAAAHARLKWYVDHVADYQDKRNFPSEDKTSLLSAALHFGEISPVQIWHALAHKSGNNSDPGWLTYVKELIWRDYAQNIICQYPDYAQVSYHTEFDRFPWRDPTSDAGAAADLKAWQYGRTGYPIVDAGMRQLWQTGWMHNRVRMIAASFLIKHLLIDWRVGEKWFWDCLVDADYASNASNWQWVAGGGVDANMFTRIMAPLTQSEKFDAAAYIRTYVPELCALEAPYIHDPEEYGRRPAAYPAKIIGHKEGRERALAAYKTLKS